MATINGTLKYKQDDGAIVELNPVGVDNTAREIADSNANAIGKWVLNNPISSIAGVIGEWDMTHDSGENITDVLAGIASKLSNEVTARKNADTALDTRITRLERLPTLELPIIGIFTDAGTVPNGTITIAVPIPSVVRLLTAKGHVPTFSISGGTIGVVFEYKDANTINSFALSSVSVSDLGVFVSITGKPAPSPLAIEPGTFVWGSYKQAATVTTLHVTFS